MARNSNEPSSSCVSGVRASSADGPGEAGVGQVAGQLGREVAGGQRVDPHAALAPLGGELPGEVDQGALVAL